MKTNGKQTTETSRMLCISQTMGSVKYYYSATKV